MPLYFAYGSNMDLAVMARHCPRAVVVGRARLPRHRFLITADGYASVVRDPRRAVHGLLWSLGLSDMPALDRYESVATGLYTKISQIVIAQGGARRALLYIGRSALAGQAKPGYAELVRAAAEAAGLPLDYIREIGQSAQAPRRRARDAGASWA